MVLLCYAWRRKLQVELIDASVRLQVSSAGRYYAAINKTGHGFQYLTKVPGKNSRDCVQKFAQPNFRQLTKILLTKVPGKTSSVCQVWRDIMAHADIIRGVTPGTHSSNIKSHVHEAFTQLTRSHNKVPYWQSLYWTWLSKTATEPWLRPSKQDGNQRRR